jgi:hypothetical protein
VPRDTPLTRAAALLESEGWRVEKARRLAGVQKSRVRLFGFIDLLAYRSDSPPLALYVADDLADLGEALRRLPGLPGVQSWLARRSRLEVLAWTKRRRQWHPHRVPLPAGVIQAPSPAPTAPAG